MATVTDQTATTLADFIEHLAVPAHRILFHPRMGEITEEEAVCAKYKLCELIDGVLVRKAMGWYESRLAVVLCYYLEHFLEAHNLGIVIGEAGLVRVKPDQLRMADVAFFSWDHFPGHILPKGQVLNVVPDLAVEILSPDNTTKEMERKRREYFAGGARLVWEVDPESRTVAVYTDPYESVTLSEDQSLDGGTVLPGFSLPIRAWFEKAGPRC